MVKRFEEETYLAKIGVNRGAGFTSAAATSRRQAGEIDEIFTNLANSAYQEAVEKGELRGQKAAREQEFINEIIKDPETGEEVTVPKRPAKPETLVGKSANQVYDKLMFDRYIEEIRLSTGKIIDEESANAVLNGTEESEFAQNSTSQLENIYKALDPEVRQLVKLKDMQHMREKGDYVNSKYLDAKYSKGILTIKDKIANNRLSIKNDIIFGNGENIDNQYNFMLQELEDNFVAEIIPESFYNSEKEIIEKRRQADKTFSERFKVFLPYNGSEEQNDEAQINGDLLYNFLDPNNKETEIEINGKIYTREELTKGLSVSEIVHIRENRIKPLSQSATTSNTIRTNTALLRNSLNNPNMNTSSDNMEYYKKAGKNAEQIVYDGWYESLGDNKGKATAELNPNDIKFLEWKLKSGYVSDATINVIKNAIEKQDIDAIIENRFIIQAISNQNLIETYLKSKTGVVQNLNNELQFNSPRARIEAYFDRKNRLRDQDAMNVGITAKLKQMAVDDFNEPSQIHGRISAKLQEIATNSENESVLFTASAFTKITQGVFNHIMYEDNPISEELIDSHVVNVYNSMKEDTQYGMSRIGLAFDMAGRTEETDADETYMKFPPEQIKRSKIAFEGKNFEKTQQYILDKFRKNAKKDEFGMGPYLLKDKPISVDEIKIRYRKNPTSQEEEFVIYYEAGDSPTDAYSIRIDGEPLVVTAQELADLYDDKPQMSIVNYE